MKRKPLSKEQRLQVWNKYEHHCAYCGKLLEYKDMQVDHINPINKEGINDISNYNPACRSCNRRKAAFTVEQFREQLDNQFNWVLRDSRVKQCMDYSLLVATKHPIVFFFEWLEKAKQVNQK